MPKRSAVQAEKKKQFPLRVAAVDVGSNALRFLAAEFSAVDRFTELETQRVPVRLGHDVFLTGRLTREAMDAAVKALAGFGERMKHLEITRYRAVATSAVRESRNGGDLIARIHEEAGIRLEPITGHEEARLVWLAVRHQIPLGKRKWILVDLGGGSVEVSLVDDAGVLWSESHTMGSVRLLEELSGGGEAPGRFRRLLGEYAATLKIPAAAKHLNPAGMIATGGNIEALARIANPNSDPDGVGVLSRAALNETIDLLSRLSYRERVEELGLREDRADVILPAAVVYERLCGLADADEILVPKTGVREGVILDLVEEIATRREHENRQEREVRTGAVALGRRYLFDQAHAKHVASLALSLFDQLTKIHGLAAADRRLLLGAALLHDIGQFVSYRKHHKHSFYLLANSELPGLTQTEIGLVALIARYHRRAEPNDSHEGYRDLPREERSRLHRLAALLRVADALDREHLQRVAGVHARIGGKAVTLRLEGEGDLLLEQWAIQKKAQMFRRVFETELIIEYTGAAAE